MNFGEREGRVYISGLGFRKALAFMFFFYLFYNIVLMWKIVGISKALVIYIYIQNIDEVYHDNNSEIRPNTVLELENT